MRCTTYEARRLPTHSPSFSSWDPRWGRIAPIRSFSTILVTLQGVVVYVVTYAWIAPRFGWPAALPAACAAFAAATVLMHALALSLLAVMPLVLLCLVAAPRLLPRQLDVAVDPAPAPRWDLPARMAVAALFILLLTSLAPLIGPKMTGLLSPFPIFVTILAVFAHRQGPRVVRQVLRGVMSACSPLPGFLPSLRACWSRQEWCSPLPLRS